MSRFLFLILALSLITFKARSQCSVVVSSTNGYSVTIKVQPVSVIPSSNSCPYGYNYNLAINYTVTFSGSNIPGALYTLQGNISCGSQSLFYSLPLGGGTGSYTTTSNPYISSDGTNVYTTHPSCTAANPTNLNCGQTNVHINGPGIADQTVNCPSNTTLPVSLSDFTATKNAKGILLNWKTLTETNNDFFSVERSTNGSDWTALAKVKGAGTTSEIQHYSFTDDNAIEGLNYYRLKQFDLDGSFNYSPIVYSVNADKENQICSNVWPNPVNDALNFQIYAGSDGAATYRIIDDMGKTVDHAAVNFHTGTTDIQISTENLASGFYLLELNFSESTKVYRKIAKL